MLKNTIWPLHAIFSGSDVVNFHLQLCVFLSGSYLFAYWTNITILHICQMQKTHTHTYQPYSATYWGCQWSLHSHMHIAFPSHAPPATDFPFRCVLLRWHHSLNALIKRYSSFINKTNYSQMETVSLFASQCVFITWNTYTHICAHAQTHSHMCMYTRTCTDTYTHRHIFILCSEAAGLEKKSLLILIANTH